MQHVLAYLIHFLRILALQTLPIQQFLELIFHRGPSQILDRLPLGFSRVLVAKTAAVFGLQFGLRALGVGHNYAVDLLLPQTLLGGLHNAVLLVLELGESLGLVQDVVLVFAFEALLALAHVLLRDWLENGLVEDLVPGEALALLDFEHVADDSLGLGAHGREVREAQRLLLDAVQKTVYVLATPGQTSVEQFVEDHPVSG